MGSAGWWWRRSGGTVGYLPGMERTHKEMQMHCECLQRGSRVRRSVALWDGGGGDIHLCDAGQFCALPSAAAASCCRRSHLPAENILNNKNASNMVVRPPVIWKLVSAEGLANIDISEIGQ